MINHKKVSGFMLRLSGILLCLVLATFYMISGLYARYTVSSETEQGASVAKIGTFELSDTGETELNDEYIIIPGDDIEKEVSVRFGEWEVGAVIFVEMRLSDSWNTSDSYTFSYDYDALEFSVIECNEQNETGWKFLKEEKNSGYTSYIYYKEMDPNTALEDYHVLQNDKISVSSTITKDSIKSMTDISVQFRATAVQYNGADSISNVWNKIS